MNNKLKPIFVLFVYVLFHQFSFAQGFKVKEFKQNLSDGSAFHAPMDAEGHPCGLIKVRTDNSELQFKGDIVGDVDNKINEYWVYIPQSCKQIKVIHPNFMPLMIPFSDYGIDISSKATYVLTLEETKYKKEKSGVTIKVNPWDADLYIDDVSVDNLSGSGLYQLYLSKGEHICKLSKSGYRPFVQVIQTGKASQDFNVELESLMAELEVKCGTATAEIYVDDELKGNGTWKGELLAGEHKIEARQQNFSTHTQTIALVEKESRTVSIPELKRSKGIIEIFTNPSGINVMIDGKNVGVSPCTIDVESGKHYVSCKSYGVIQTRSDVEVNSGKLEQVSLEIKFSEGWLKEYYQQAYNGDVDAILWMAIDKNWRGEYEESVFWMEKFPQRETMLKNWESYWTEKQNKNDDVYGWWRCHWIQAYSEAGMPEKALELLPFFKKDAERNGGSYDESGELCYIGNGFLKKKDIERAIQCFEKAGADGYEGMGDCYKAKGNKQLAASYYRKCLSKEYVDNRNRVEKKLKELGY